MCKGSRNEYNDFLFQIMRSILITVNGSRREGKSQLKFLHLYEINFWPWRIFLFVMNRCLEFKGVIILEMCHNYGIHVETAWPSSGKHRPPSLLFTTKQPLNLLDDVIEGKKIDQIGSSNHIMSHWINKLKNSVNSCNKIKWKALIFHILLTYFF